MADSSRSQTHNRRNIQGLPLSPKRDISESFVVIFIEVAIFLVLYLLTGVLIIYSMMESFNFKPSPHGKVEELIATFYFLFYTLFTVGYGDIRPVKGLAKFFTSLLVLFGCGIVVVRFKALVDHISNKLEAHIFRCVNECQKIIVKGCIAFIVIIICIGIGMVGACAFEKLGPVDSFYLSVVSISTVGYGDCAFKTQRGKKFAIYWLVLNVVVNKAFVYLAQHIFTLRNFTRSRRGNEEDPPKEPETPTSEQLDIANLEISENKFLDNPQNSDITASTFEDLNLSQQVLKGLYVEMGFKKPSKIQAMTLPKILKNPYKDLFAQAHSGSGKTACSALAMLSGVEPKLKAPQVLCICPTKELAIQNMKVLQKMGKYTGIDLVCTVATERRSSASSWAREPVSAQIVLGTAGTIRNWMSIKKLDVSSVKVLVFDEADRMLAVDGFEDDSLGIMEMQRISLRCQVLLFCSTLNESVTNMQSHMVKDGYEFVEKKEELSLQDVKQYKVYCPNELTKYQVIKTKIFELGENLEQRIIFVRTKDRARMLHERLTQDGYSVTTILGALTSEERGKIVKEFRDGLTQLLITTDVFAPGFDQKQINCVVNYDLPMKNVADPSTAETLEPDYQVYKHRVGRVGLFSRKRAVFNLFCDDLEDTTMSKIEQYFKIKIPEVQNTEEDFEDALEAAGLRKSLQ